MKYVLSLLLLVAVLITAGCVSDPKTPTTTIVYKVDIPTTFPTVTTIPYAYATQKPESKIITVATPSPTLINSIGTPGWEHYTNYDDHFSIYKPSDWTIIDVDKSKIHDEGKTDISNLMDKYVYIYSPNMKGFIMIYGTDLSGTLFSIFNDPGKTQISDEFYDAFVKGAESAIYSNGNNQMTIKSAEKDNNYYLINGNPARHVRFNVQINGQSLSTDCYLIAHENTYYSEWYFAMVGSSQADASTASNIMLSFTTTT